MPNFSDIEASEDSGRPYEKYVFQYGPGSGDKVTYTNAVVEVNGAEPTSTTRDGYKTTSKAERDQLNITLPASSDIGMLVLPYPPPWQVEVTIYQGHFNADNEAVVWSGRVLSNSFNEKGEVSFTCESTLIQLKRRGPKRRWQLGCPLLLYGQGDGRCNAPRDDFTVTTNVVDVNVDGVPSFPASWFEPFPIQKFVHGIMSWQSPNGHEFRTIRRVAADTNRVFFNGLLRGLEPGTEVKLSLGCNHLQGVGGDCGEVFNNILNYGGDPTIPLENPVKNANFW